MWILIHDLGELYPLLIELLFVPFGVHDDAWVLRQVDHLFRPVAEEFDVRHEVEVGLPERLFALQMLVDQEHDQGQLLPVALLLAEDVRVLPDDLAEYGMPLSAFHREQHLVRHADESFPVLDRLLGPHANKPALEIGRVLKLRD